ncbi:MAG: GNAT family N-acetyltransferase [Oscillospiraceae bacterium]|nr:GNAT family N-acetyltransferase [Oscillospiraceae bacterium]
MKLLCFGDSNTYGYDPRSCFGGRYPAEVRWTDVLAQSTGWEVLNAGQNGREIPRRAGELAQADRLLADCGPMDALAVMLGSNDLLQSPAMTAGTVAERMSAFLRRVLERCPPETVLLAAPPPMRLGTWVTEERLLRESAGLADAYAALAGEMGLRFADAGQWGVELVFDGVHFSPAGHRAFAAGIQAALEAMPAPDIWEVSRRSPELIRQLTAVWERSVRATHRFLTEDDLQAIAREVPEALSAVPRLAVASVGGGPAGFLGADGERLEMLFLSPAVQGRGLGRQLLEWGIRRYGIREVCVNEQNPQALGFYQRMGFRPYQRTELDGQGRPFPLLYLRREDTPCSWG